jgi:hypothetical protein
MPFTPNNDLTILSSFYALLNCPLYTIFLNQSIFNTEATALEVRGMHYESTKNERLGRRLSVVSKLFRYIRRHFQ